MNIIKPKDSNISNVLKSYKFWCSIIAAIAAIVYLGTVCKGCSQEKTEWISSKSSVLYEVQGTRDYLAQFILFNDSNWRTLSTRTLLNNDQIPKIFSDDMELSKKVQSLYTSLNTGLNYINNFYFTTEDKQRVIQAIQNIISQADEVGPLIAKSVNAKWEVPPKNLSKDELIKYYIDHLHKQDASGEQIIFWQSK